MHKTLIVSDELSDLENPDIQAISFESYLQDYPKKGEPKTRVINLCDVSAYLSQGYYCSLLAEARQHQVLPSVKVINSLRPKANTLQVQIDVTELLPDNAVQPLMFAAAIYLYFGHAADSSLQRLANRVFRKYPAPILKINLVQAGDRVLAQVERASVSSLAEDEKSRFHEQLHAFTQTLWKTKSEDKQYRWEMAILVDPKEPNAPSDSQGLEQFVKAARKLSINAQLLSREQITNIAHFDALFIRETTAIDHHTYELAVQAEEAGLVVIDDSQSILRCCNKAFLHDAFSYQNVPTPKTHILHSFSDDTLQELEREFGFPMVLKMPEGSFSRGVYKVKTAEELKHRLTKLFQFTALVLVQEYMFTDYDWRIGILNGRALYASRYQMARNHWQIYNHGAKRNVSGGFDTLPTFEVPKAVLDAAMRAARIVGTGLYGVDVKEKDGKPYVLEVNDNPSLDYKVEDAYLGKDLYMQIMTEFQLRLEARGRK